jgi:hypothetical protein
MAKEKTKKVVVDQGGGNMVYGLGLIGAAVYFVGQANGLGEVIVALLKALVWPAFLVYELLKFIAA